MATDVAAPGHAACPGLLLGRNLRRMGSRYWLVIVVLVLTAGCANKPEPDIVGICQPAIELELPSGEFEYVVSTYGYTDSGNGRRQQWTGAVDAADGAYFFECEINDRMHRTDLQVEQMSVK